MPKSPFQALKKPNRLSHFITVAILLVAVILVRGNPSNKSGRRGGVCVPMWMTLDGGRGDRP